jgi:Ca2+-binding RTX toxin-like protein
MFSLVMGVSGGAGNDTLIGGDGYDTLHGGAGNDYASYYYSVTDVTIDLNTAIEPTGNNNQGDTLMSIEHLQGSLTANNTLSGDNNNNYLISYNGADTLSGGAGNDVLITGAGNDVLKGEAGNDSLNGSIGDDLYIFANDVAQGTDSINELVSAGNDTISFTGNTAVNVNLALTTNQTINSNLVLKVVNLENIIGGGGNDTLTGNSQNNIFNGGDGNDTLTGGLGNDTFVFSRLGVDTISDFTVGEDKILLNVSLFTGIYILNGQDSILHPNSFAIITDDTAAVSLGNSKIGYNSTNGHLFYNNNQFAQLTIANSLALSSNDFIAPGAEID